MIERTLPIEVACAAALAVTLATGFWQSSVAGRPPASVQVAAAVKRAASENKSVFVDFGASWCGPCVGLHALFDAPETRGVWNAHYVVVHLNVWERDEANNDAGAELLMQKWGGGRSIPYTVILDAAGAVIASDGGYPGAVADIPPFLAFVGRGSRPFTIAERDTLESYLIVHSNGLGTIAGRVTDDSGRPAAGARVAAITSSYVSGVWRPSARASSVTDSDGRYVIENLSAATYTVATEPATKQTAAFPPTFAPSTHGVDTAQRIVLTRAQGLVGVDIRMARATALSVSGVVRTSTGSPAPNAVVTVTSVNWPLGSWRTTTTAGAFTFRGVWPGRYQLLARADTPGSPRSAEVGLVSIDVSSEAPSPVALEMSRTATITGTIHFDGVVISAADRAAVQITAVAIAPAAGSPGDALARINPDGQFRIDGLYGKRILRVSGLSGSWTLKSVTQGAKDITDAPMAFAGGESTQDVDVLITSRSGSLGGVVRPVGKGGAVIVFGADPASWAYPSRFVRSAPVQTDGTFAVRALPAGTYLCAAIPSVEPAWDAPESLQRLRARATPVRIIDGQRAAVTLTLP